MPLLSKQLVEIIGTTKVRFSPGGTRRGAGRVPVKLQATARRFIGKPTGPAVAIQVTDLSIEGVRLLYPESLLPGEEIVICFTPAAAPRVQLRYSVRRCTNATGGRFLIGGQYAGSVADA